RDRHCDAGRDLSARQRRLRRRPGARGGSRDGSRRGGRGARLARPGCRPVDRRRRARRDVQCGERAHAHELTRVLRDGPGRGVLPEARGGASAFGTPAFSVIVSSVWAIVLAATGSFEQLFTYVIFAAWVFYALAGASVFVLRWRRPDASRPFRVPGYPWTPLVFVASAAAIVLN